MSIGDIYKVRIVTNQGLQLGLMIQHWSVTSEAGVGATPLQIATAIDGATAGLLAPIMTSQATYRGVGVQRIFPGAIPDETAVNTNTQVGGLAGDPLPLQVAGLISWKTGLAGRRNRGRTFIPFPSEGVSGADGRPTGGYVTNLGLLRDAWINGVIAGAGGNTSTLRIGVYSRLATAWRQATLGIASPLWATQRPRSERSATALPPF